jgi:hypothetical protein
MSMATVWGSACDSPDDACNCIRLICDAMNHILTTTHCTVFDVVSPFHEVVYTREHLYLNKNRVKLLL